MIIIKGKVEIKVLFFYPKDWTGSLNRDNDINGDEAQQKLWIEISKCLSFFFHLEKTKEKWTKPIDMKSSGQSLLRRVPSPGFSFVTLLISEQNDAFSFLKR